MKSGFGLEIDLKLDQHSVCLGARLISCTEVARGAAKDLRRGWTVTATEPHARKRSTASEVAGVCEILCAFGVLIFVVFVRALGALLSYACDTLPVEALPAHARPHDVVFALRLWMRPKCDHRAQGFSHSYDGETCPQERGPHVAPSCSDFSFPRSAGTSQSDRLVTA
jgi:hypothetical protein